MNSSALRSSEGAFPASNTSVVLSTTGLVFIIILALGGNILVVVAFYRSSNLRSVTNVFIVSLAVTDILVASISIPIWSYFQLSGALPKTATSARSNALYQMWKCLDILFSTASIMNLCMISVDRFIAIISPLKYIMIMTAQRATISLIFIWLYASVLASLGLALWPYYATFLYIVAFLAPLVVMVYCYSHIFRTALVQARRIGPFRQTYYFKREIKAAKTLAIVMGTFVACWGPFFTLNLLFNYVEKLPGFTATVVTAIKWFHYGNSALNPIIYSCTNRDFRNKIFKVLPCKLCTSLERRSVAQSVVFWTTSFRSSLQNFSVRVDVHNGENGLENTNGIIEITD